MLKILLKPQAEEIIAEEQAGFRAGWSTSEQIFNLRILCEKYLQHQQSLYHVFIDLKKAFDKVWHAALWATTRKYNIGSKLVRTIEHLYDNATSAVINLQQQHRRLVSNNSWSSTRMPNITNAL